jgi:hypothetical protein
MIRTTITLSHDEWERVNDLGLYTPKQWPVSVIPDMMPNASRGVRRAIALAEPYIDAEIARIKAEHEARATKRRAWIDDEPRRTAAYLKRAARKQGLEPEDF